MRWHCVALKLYCVNENEGAEKLWNDSSHRYLVSSNLFHQYHLQDRVIINRLDSICHAVLKGKWPSSNEHYDSHSSQTANSLGQHQHHQAAFFPSLASSSLPIQAGVQQANPGLGFSIPHPITRQPKVKSHQTSTDRHCVLCMSVLYVIHISPLAHTMVHYKTWPICQKC